MGDANQHQHPAEDGHGRESDWAIVEARPVGHADRSGLAGDTGAEQPEGAYGGRWLSLLGAIALLVGLFLSWYQLVRPNGFTETTTGWQTFTNLRWGLLLGGIACVVAAFLVQTKPIVWLRIVVGLVGSALIIRRIVSPPDLPGTTVTSQLGVYVAMLGALGILLGGLLGLGGSEDDQEAGDERADPVSPAGDLPPGTPAHEPVDAVVVDEPAGQHAADGR